MPVKIFYLTMDPIEYKQRLQNQIELARALHFQVQAFSLAESGKACDDSGYPFPLQRIRIRFKRGPLRFILFNFKAFAAMVFRRCDILHFRGLWVVPAVLFYRLFHRCTLVYDANEYFAGHQLFDHSPVRRWIWLSFEKMIITYLDVLITVSEPLAQFYRDRYPNLRKVEVIRNLPSIRFSDHGKRNGPADAGGPVRIIFHGFFLPGRALFQIIDAVASLGDLDIKVTLIGEGPLRPALMDRIKRHQPGERIQILPFVPNSELIPLISRSDIGLAVIEPDCINRTYALPNKFFEFIMAGVPVLASTIPTLKAYVEKYGVGKLTDPWNVDEISRTLRYMINHPQERNLWRKNCLVAAEELNWEQESLKMTAIYRSFTDKSKHAGGH